jgi:hypothetical protein
MKGIHACTPIWGTAYIENYLNYVLPSLLAKNNLPFLCSKKNFTYTIYTYSEYKKLILHSKNFSNLKKVCATNINTSFLEKYRSKSTNYKVHEQNIKLANFCYSDCIKFANKKNFAFFWIPPDCIHAENNFKNFYDYIVKGYRVVYVPGGLRVSLMKIKNNLKKFIFKDGTLKISSKNLVNLSVKNIYPKHVRSVFYNYIKTSFQFETFWPVKTIGILVRTIVGQNSIFIYPRTKKNYIYKNISIEASSYIDKCVTSGSEIAYISDSNFYYACPIENYNYISKNYSIFKVSKKNFFFNKPNKIAMALNMIDYIKCKSIKNFICKPIRYRIDGGTMSDDNNWLEIEKKTDYYSKKIYAIFKFLNKYKFFKTFAYKIVQVDYKISSFFSKYIIKSN